MGYEGGIAHWRGKNGEITADIIGTLMVNLLRSPTQRQGQASLYTF